MKSYQVSVFDPPQSFVDGTAFQKDNLLRSTPIAAAFTSAGLPSEIRECLLSLEFALALNGKRTRYEGSPENSDFCDLIRMLECQLDKSCEGSRSFIGSLHRARKLRNHLAHGFFGSEEIHDIATQGGQEKMLARLRDTERVFFPLIMTINLITRACAADYGFTNEVFDRIVSMRKRQQAQVERELNDILADNSGE
jgi:hypothetical protein